LGANIGAGYADRSRYVIVGICGGRRKRAGPARKDGTFPKSATGETPMTPVGGYFGVVASLHSIARCTRSRELWSASFSLMCAWYDSTVFTLR
jgi:hypothetical protein